LPEEDPQEVEEAPEDGVYIYGLFMDGARWDRETAVISDQRPSEMYDKMPLIWFKPIEDYKPDPEEYSCPVYKTSVRAGMLSTTGQSTNFIISVEIPTKE
jgi:dynein heavy chain